jgi:hypothetical protein
MRVARRELLTLLPLSFLSALQRQGRAASADDSMHILKPGDVERLRMDFNASRSKVRLFLLLSPT